MNKKPNILMIVTDQEYAHQPMPAEFALPSRDRIRARGVTFNNHHCTTTVCTPSRSVIYTGQAYAAHPHVRQHQFRLDRRHEGRSENLAHHRPYAARSGLPHRL